MQQEAPTGARPQRQRKLSCLLADCSDVPSLAGVGQPAAARGPLPHHPPACPRPAAPNNDGPGCCSEEEGEDGEAMSEQLSELLSQGLGSQEASSPEGMGGGGSRHLGGKGGKGRKRDRGLTFTAAECKVMAAKPADQLQETTTKDYHSHWKKLEAFFELEGFDISQCSSWQELATLLTRAIEWVGANVPNYCYARKMPCGLLKMVRSATLKMYVAECTKRGWHDATPLDDWQPFVTQYNSAYIRANPKKDRPVGDPQENTSGGMLSDEQAQQRHAHQLEAIGRQAQAAAASAKAAAVRWFPAAETVGRVEAEAGDDPLLNLAIAAVTHADKRGAGVPAAKPAAPPAAATGPLPMVQPAPAAVANQVACWVHASVRATQSSTQEQLQALQEVLERATARLSTAASSGDAAVAAATAAALATTRAASKVVSTIAPILHQQHALLAASLAMSVMGLPQQAVEAEGSLTANRGVHLQLLTELLPLVAAESAGSADHTASTASVAAAGGVASAALPTGAGNGDCSLTTSASRLGSVYMAAERYYVGAGGVAAWCEQEQQTNGKWREGRGNKKDNQKRQQLWYQLKHLMALVEEVAAARGLNLLPAAQQIDAALCASSLNVAGASRRENTQRVRELLQLPLQQAARGACNSLYRNVSSVSGLYTRPLC